MQSKVADRYQLTVLRQVLCVCVCMVRMVVVVVVVVGKLFMCYYWEPRISARRSWESCGRVAAPACSSAERQAMSAGKDLGVR